MINYYMNNEFQMVLSCKQTTETAFNKKFSIIPVEQHGLVPGI